MSTINKQNRSILIVDDEDIIRDLIDDIILDSLGVKTYKANCGQKALELFNTFKDKIALVTLDVRMPHMDGVEVFKFIRELDPDIPVIFCSGYSDNPELTDLIDNKKVFFIQKPFDTKKFMDRVSRLMNESVQG